MMTMMVAAALVAGGQPRAQVVTECATNAQIRYAAQELTNWVAKISGAALPVDDAAADLPTTILLGTPETSAKVAAFAAGRKDDFARIGDSDGFVISEGGGFFGFGGQRITIAAADPKGVLNGVYRFLERNSDIIWARPQHGDDGFGTIYGYHPDLENGIADLVDVPSFPQHRCWTNPGAEMTRHEERLLNRFSDGQYLLPNAMLDKHFAAHPEVAALQANGKRYAPKCWGQICYMHPKTLELFTLEAEKKVAAAPKGPHEWFVGIADSWAVCECELCKKPISLPDGTVVEYTNECFRSTQYNLFLNRVAENLRKKHPDFGTIRSDAYLFLSAPPAFKTGRPVGPYAPYVKNHKKPVYDDDVNAVWHRRAENYRKAGMPFVSLYEYYLCHTTPQYPHAVSEVAQQDYRYYLPEMKGIYLDVSGDKGNGGPFELSAIEFWTMSRVMWDVNVDVKAARREFCRRAYREAAPLMTEYHERLAADYNADPTGCFWNDDPVIAAKHYIVEKGLAGWVRDILARAEAAAVHPGSKELIARHRARMLDLVDRAEKAPKRITYTVRQLLGAPDLDPNGTYWKDVEPVGPITKVSRQEPVSNVTIKVAHDRTCLHVLFEFRDQPRFLKKWKEYADAGKVDNFDPRERFEWDTPVEIYIDGDLKAKGSYYMFSNMFNGHRTTCIGSADGDPVDWRVKMQPAGTGLALLASFPFSSVGIDISTGNKVGAMFVMASEPRSAWNGGQWHSPGGFQTLMLEMK